VRNVPDDRLVYYNLDAYTLYRPERAERIRRQEEELVERAGQTICLSKQQVQAIRGRHPSRADRIEHFPLGVVESFLNPSLKQFPDSRAVGYVGNLGHRVDWPLVDKVLERCRDLTFVFAGELEGGEHPDGGKSWKKARSRALDRPNAQHLGRIPQKEVTNVYWRSAINWIPYETNHPFNRASCPTKIMDSIASGRPVVSTSVPECTLYPRWITIADGPDELAEALRQKTKGLSAHPAEQQIQFARRHTWSHRAETFREIIAGRGRESIKSPEYNG
jgi:glycosyltransferase involved in cell wall biosynthesis